MSKVRDRKLISTYGQRILDAGFYALPNMVLDYQDRLGLEDDELVYFIKVTHFLNPCHLRPRDLSMSAGKTRLYTIRNNLIKKGYLRLIELEKRGDYIYDWSGLIVALNALIEDETIPPGGIGIPPGGIPFIIGKEYLKEQQQQQKDNTNEKDEKDVVVVLRLVKMGMSERVARELIEQYPMKRIEEKLVFCEKRMQDWEVNNPGGWLRKAIEEDWNVEDKEFDSQKKIEQAKIRYQKIKQSVEKKV